LQLRGKAFARERRIKEDTIADLELDITMGSVVRTAVGFSGLVEVVEDECTGGNETLAQICDVVGHGLVGRGGQHRGIEDEVEWGTRGDAVEDLERGESGGRVDARVVRPCDEWQCEIPVLWYNYIYTVGIWNSLCFKLAKCSIFFLSKRWLLRDILSSDSEDLDFGQYQPGSSRIPTDRDSFHYLPSIIAFVLSSFLVRPLGHPLYHRSLVNDPLHSRQGLRGGHAAGRT